MRPHVEILRFSRQWAVVPRFGPVVRRAVLATFAEAKAEMRSDVAVAVSLSDDAQVRQLNARWRGIDKPTNVLSFPASRRLEIDTTSSIGDIVLAYETVAREAHDENKSTRDHAAHLVIHGLLHLLGYDHDTRECAEAMERIEVLSLARLNISDPYLDGVLLKAAQ
jgi:probable rRNA maturation factor